ncbi:DUF47 family protein [Candidatus Micrarchaeota archaeon]|nr:DUF47 family protein [Candidatus Micrarchaeota archaeon]
MPLSRIKRLLVPQDNLFFELMLKQAETAHSAAQELLCLFSNYNNVQKESEKIKDLEHEGDKLMREIYTALNKTFIVPIDHQDISTLATALDDVIDLIDHVSTLLVVYGIKEPTLPMVHLAEILVDQTKELKNAVASINHSKTYTKVSDHCKNIKQLENRADESYIKALNAAQHISDIVMKHS